MEFTIEKQESSHPARVCEVVGGTRKKGASMTQIFAIDPGNERSAFVVMDRESHELLGLGLLENQELLDSLGSWSIHWAGTSNGMARLSSRIDFESPTYCIEMIASYGMPVGKEVFETCLWIGRYIEAISRLGQTASLVYRKDVKMHLCGSTRAKDGNIRQAILDKYPRIGGGKIPQIGTKLAKGPLYGVHDDIWAALAVAITFAEAKATSSV